MKAKYIRDDQELSPTFYHLLPELLADGRVAYRDIMRNGEIQPVPFFTVGAVVDTPDAYWLVRQGVAIPADEACRVRARMPEARFNAAKLAYDRMINHIKPEDRKLFDDGVILGYDEDGNFKPGPNYAKLNEYLEAEKAASVADEEDDI